MLQVISRLKSDQTNHKMWASGSGLLSDRMGRNRLFITLLLLVLLSQSIIASEVLRLDAVLSDCTILSTDGSIPFHIDHQCHRESSDGVIESIIIQDLTEHRSILSFKVFSGRRGIIEGISEGGRWKARVTRPHGSRYFTTQIVPGLFIPLNSGSVIIFAMAANIHLTDFHLDSCLDHVNQIIKASRNTSDIPANFFLSPNRVVCDGIVIALSKGIGNQISQFLKSPKLKRPSSKNKPRRIVWVDERKREKEMLANKSGESGTPISQLSKFSLDFINSQEPSDSSCTQGRHYVYNLECSPNIRLKGSLSHIVNDETEDMLSDI